MESNPIDNNQKVYLGFASKAETNSLSIENFPSKIGGLPEWLMPIPESFSNDFFYCSLCKKELSFMMQVYCPLEEKENCFHRMIYLFFCSNCWKTKTNTIKVLRVQLPENSSFYNGETLLKKEELKNNKKIAEVQNILKQGLILKEFIIETSEEVKEATHKYIQFYNNLEEKSVHSKNSNLNLDDDDNDENIEIGNNITKEEMNKYNEQIKKYIKDNPNENIYQVQKDESSTNNKGPDKDDFLEINKDPIFELFQSVINYDKKQVIRYYRTDFFPLWFSKKEMLTLHNTKCKNCGKDVIFEFQVMPYIFILQPMISNIDIGTIVIYTCCDSCQRKTNKEEGEFLEEYGFIQRTGEGIFDTNKKYQPLEDKVVEMEAEDDKMFGGFEEGEADEEGFVEVKKKKKKNKP